LGFEILGALCVCEQTIGLIVLTSIDFDDEALLVTGEVREKRTDRGLPPEMRVLDG
jgi:hypothetical protein